MDLEQQSRMRLRVLGVVSVSLFVALFGRLWYLQALETESLQAVAAQNITETIRTEAPRGRILDVKGRVLVNNRLSTVVTVNREDLRQRLVDRDMESDERAAFRDEMFIELARELSASGQLTKVRDLERAFDDPSFLQFDDIPVARDVDPELLIFIGERPEEFPGVEVTTELVRDYPYGSLAAHILGYVGSINEVELEQKKIRWTQEGIEGPEAPRVPIENGKPYRSNDEIGKEGIERFFEDDLRGIPGTRTIEVDNFGNLVREIEEGFQAPQQGSDVILTIDIDVQAEVEAELKRALDRARETPVNDDDPPLNAPAGASVVLDPRNGDVIAMASYPTFDPGNFIEGLSIEQKRQLDDPTAHQPLLNRAVGEIYPAASTFKPFVLVAAEEYGVFGWQHIDPWEVPISDPGYWILVSCGLGLDPVAAERDGCKKNNAGDARMEGVDLRHSLTFSSDTYYYRLGEAFWISNNDEIPDDGIQEVASRFGMGTATGIQLPGEKAGLMPTAELMAARHEANPDAFPFGDWTSGNNANISIGQGDVAITPLQLANAYATIANGGTLYAPNVVRSIDPPDGSDDLEFGPRVVREIDIPDTIEQEILDGLLGVTLQPKVQEDRPGGTAFDAFNVPDKGGVTMDLINWPVAGKTGTAEVGNGSRADSSMFAGFGPSGSATWGTAINEPEFVVVTILEESGFGSRHAAPMVARLMEMFSTNSVPEALTQDEVDQFYGVDDLSDLVDIVP